MSAYEYRVSGETGQDEWTTSETFDTYGEALEWISIHKPLLRRSGQSEREWIERREVGEWKTIPHDEQAGLALMSLQRKEKP